MDTDVIGFVYQLKWTGNNEPPSGVRVLFEKFVPFDGKSRRDPPEINELWKPGTGYAVCVEAVTKPGKRQSPETVGKRRKDALRKRLDRDYPLFADQMYADELAKRPDYYAGKNPNDDKREMLAQFEQERYERYMKIIREMRQEAVDGRSI